MEVLYYFLFFLLFVLIPAHFLTLLEDRSIQQIHKALGIKNLKPAKNPKGRPYGKIEVVREFGSMDRRNRNRVILSSPPTAT